MDGRPFHAYRELKRVYSYVNVTEDGMYKEDEVPPDYAGASILKVEVVHEIFLSDKTGKILHFYYDIPEAKDQDDLTEGGYTNATTGVDYVDHAWYPNPSGSGSQVRTKLYERVTARMEATAKSKSDAMLTHYNSQVEAETNP